MEEDCAESQELYGIYIYIEMRVRTGIKEIK